VTAPKLPTAVEAIKRLETTVDDPAAWNTLFVAAVAGDPDARAFIDALGGMAE
jgi:hypothetical protein